jgi:hypothetical protein
MPWAVAWLGWAQGGAAGSGLVRCTRGEQGSNGAGRAERVAVADNDGDRHGLESEDELGFFDFLYRW